MTTTILAANWKMHLSPSEARAFLNTFLPLYEPTSRQEIWLFPSAIALEAVANATADRADIVVGAQHVYWEPSGAFTGELSVAMAAEAGAGAALVGHSERRHVFGETDAEIGEKIRALLLGAVRPVLCVGEKLDEREAGQTVAVVQRQLSVLDGLDAQSLGQIVVAYEPVWAIGTGRTVTAADAATVHRAIRDQITGYGATVTDIPVLYGGSVKPANARVFLHEPDVNGVLVGGASLDPVSWSEICRSRVD